MVCNTYNLVKALSTGWASPRDSPLVDHFFDGKEIMQRPRHKFMPTRELHHLGTVHNLALEDTASPKGLVLICTGSVISKHVVGVPRAKVLWAAVRLRCDHCNLSSAALTDLVSPSLSDIYPRTCFCWGCRPSKICFKLSKFSLRRTERSSSLHAAVLGQATLVARRRSDRGLGTESQFVYLVLTVTKGEGCCKMADLYTGELMADLFKRKDCVRMIDILFQIFNSSICTIGFLYIIQWFGDDTRDGLRITFPIHMLFAARDCESKSS